MNTAVSLPHYLTDDVLDGITCCHRHNTVEGRRAMIRDAFRLAFSAADLPLIDRACDELNVPRSDVLTIYRNPRTRGPEYPLWTYISADEYADLCEKHLVECTKAHDDTKGTETFTDESLMEFVKDVCLMADRNRGQSQSAELAALATQPAQGVQAAGEAVACANCGIDGATVEGDYPDEERFCNEACRTQHDELGCPSEGSHSGFRHPEESARLIACENVLRSLASYLGAGGYNAPTVDPDVFEEKIRWGIDQLTNRRELCPGCDMPQCRDAERCAAPTEDMTLAAPTVADRMPQWISVDDRLPDDGVLVVTNSESGFNFDMMDEGCWRQYTDDVEEVGMIGGCASDVKPPTHWFQLPGIGAEKTGAQG